MRRVTILVLFLLVALTWGTTWLAMRIAAENYPSGFCYWDEVYVCGTILNQHCMVKKNTASISTRATLVPACDLCFLFCHPFSLMIYGETYVSSGLASIIFANMPVAILIASSLFLNEKTNSLQIVGLTIAIVALAGILLEETKTSAESHWQGILALVSAVIIHAIIYTQCKKKSCTVSVVTFNALPCFLAGLILSTTGWSFERPQVSAFSAHSILATLYLGAFAGVFGILCYFALQQKASAFRLHLFSLFFP